MSAAMMFMPVLLPLIEFVLYLQVALGLAGTPIPARAPLDPAALLPHKAFGFVTLGRDPAFDQAWRQSLAALGDARRAELARHRTRFNLLAEIGLQREALAGLGSKLAYLHFCFDGVTREDGPSLALLVEMADEQAAATLVERPDSLFRLRGKPKPGAHAGHQLVTLRLHGGPRFVLGRHGATLVLGPTPQATARFLGWLDKPPAQALAGTERFKRSSLAGQERPRTAFYLDLRNLLDGARATMSRRDALQLDQIDTVLGLSDMQMLHGGLRCGEEGAELDLALDHDAASRPLAALLPRGATADPALLALAPPDSGMLVSLQLADALSLDTLRQRLLATGKQMETRDFEQFFAEVEKFLGAPLAKVAGELTGQAVLAVGNLDVARMLMRNPEWQRPAYPGPPLTFLFGFKSAEQGAARWSKVADYLAGQLGPKVEKTHGKTTYLEIGKQIKIAGAMLGKTLVVTLPAERLPALIDQHAQGGPGPRRERLAAADRRPATLRTAYSLDGGMLFLSTLFLARGYRMHRAMPPGPRGAGKPFKPKSARLFPGPAAPPGELAATLSIERRQAGMLRLTSSLWGADPAAQMLLVLRRIDNLARLSCMDNYRTLYRAYQKHEHDKSKPPATLADLEQTRIWFSRCSTRGRGGDKGFLVNPKPDAKLAAPERVLVYGRRGNHHGGRIVLFADGGVRWVAAADFAGVAQKNGLPQADPAEQKKAVERHEHR